MRQRERERDRLRQGQTDRQTDRQTGRQTDRELIVFGIELIPNGAEGSGCHKSKTTIQ